MGKQSLPEILRWWISAWILLALQTLELRRVSIPKQTNTKKWIHQLLRQFHPADSQTPDSAWVPASPGVPSFGSRWWTRCNCQYRHRQNGGSGGGSHDCWAAPRVVACQHCSPVSPLEFLTLGKRGKAQFLHLLVKMLLWSFEWSSHWFHPNLHSYLRADCLALFCLNVLRVLWKWMLVSIICTRLPG